MECVKATSTQNVCRLFSGKSVAVETKYDGERIQVHISQGPKITIFNKSKRNATIERQAAHQFIFAGLGLADTTFIERIGYKLMMDASRIQDIIIEGEILTFDKHINDFEEFGGVRAMQQFSIDGFNKNDTTHYSIIWFDILWLNGQNLMTMSYETRRKTLEIVVEPIPDFVRVCDRELFDFSKPNSLDAFRDYYAQTIFDRKEGVIIKPLDSRYEAYKAGIWCKLKKDYIPGLGDSLDFAVIGGSLASRSDSKFTIGENRHGGMLTKYIAACLVNKKEVLQNSCRPIFQIVFSVEAGQSDFDLKDFEIRNAESRVANATANRSNVTSKLPYDIVCEKSGISWRSIDFFFTKPYVFELLGSGFTREAGDLFYTLRFPRVVKERTDITWQECIDMAGLQQQAQASLISLGHEEKTEIMEKLMQADHQPVTPAKAIRSKRLANDLSPPVKIYIESKLKKLKLSPPPTISLLDEAYFYFYPKSRPQDAKLMKTLKFSPSATEESVSRTDRSARTVSTLEALISIISARNHGIIFCTQADLPNLQAHITKADKLKNSVTIVDARILDYWNGCQTQGHELELRDEYIITRKNQS
eukprot:Partr_v1_DN28331_c1_g1_i2_m78770 putative DNA ligase